MRPQQDDTMGKHRKNHGFFEVSSQNIGKLGKMHPQDDDTMGKHRKNHGFLKVSSQNVGKTPVKSMVLWETHRNPGKKRGAGPKLKIDYGARLLTQ